MPAAPTAPPPTAPAVTPAAPAAASPRPDTPPPSSRTPEGRKNPAWDAIRANLQKTAGVETVERPGTEAPATKPAVKPAAKADEGRPDKTGAKTAAQPENGEANGGDQPAEQPAVDGKGEKRPSPWKLVDQFKTRALKLEQELATLRERALPEDKWREHQERLTAAEKRAKEYEDEFRYTNYQKSTEFKEKFQQPYEKAWAKAMADLSDVTIGAEDGTSRRFNDKDMLDLLNRSLPAARELADTLYGALADDVLSRRDKIRDAHDAMKGALDDAKTNGATRDQERRQSMEREFGEVAGHVRSAFDQANEKILAHPVHGKWLKPTEGDDEGNEALEKGYAFARDAFQAKPLARNLSPEARAKAASKHAALINRAAAYTRLRLAVEKRDARIAELEKKLGQFNDSIPGGGAPGGGSTSTDTGGDTRSQLFGALRKLAR